MKHLLSVILLMSSLSSFAYDRTLEAAVVEEIEGLTTEPIKGKQSLNLRKAIKNELADVSFKCKWAPANGPTNKSIAKQLKEILSSSKTGFLIYDEADQEGILAFAPISSSVEVTVMLQTTPDLKKITGIKITKESISRIRKNIGSLKAPQFELVSERTLELEGFCSIK